MTSRHNLTNCARSLCVTGLVLVFRFFPMTALGCVHSVLGERLRNDYIYTFAYRFSARDIVELLNAPSNGSHHEAFRGMRAPIQYINSGII